jgi:hypothetical protein
MLRAKCSCTETCIKYTWTFPDEKTHNQINQVLIERRWSIIFDILSFRGVDSDTDHYLVITKVRKRLAVIKQTARKLEGEELISGR